MFDFKIRAKRIELSLKLPLQQSTAIALENGLTSRRLSKLESLMISDRQPSRSKRGKTFINNKVKCFKCNKNGHIANECRNKDKNMKCTYCLRMGHIEPECRTKREAQRKKGKNRHNNSIVNACLTDSDLSPLAEALNVMLKKHTHGDLIIQELLLCGKPFRCIIDTGSQITIISRRTFMALKIKHEPYEQVQIQKLPP